MKLVEISKKRCPKNTKKPKAQKKSTTTKPFKQLRGGKFRKYTENIKNCRTFKEATKRPKGAKKRFPKSQKKGAFIAKITKNQFYQIPKMAEFTKITFYNDKKKLLTTCLKTENGTRIFFLLKLPESANKCKKVLKVPQGAQQKPNISKNYK